MKKINCVVSCPLDTYSGYGRRSVDLVKELIYNYPDWNIQILSQRWGDTRFGYLENHGEWDLRSHIVPGITQKPDIWIQITVPNEFQPVGVYNIGITAAMETTLCDASWVEGCNRMDLVLVSSQHGKSSLLNSVYTNNQTGKELRVTKPIEVLFEGIDTGIFYPKEPRSKTRILENVKNSWNFLCVGHWMQGAFGEDRKNIGFTLKAFLETFKDRDRQPGLILKSSQAVASTMDQEQMLNRIADIADSVSYRKNLPPIYLLHGDLTDQEMNDVYNDPRVKAMVSFTKGEGYGRPLAEFATIGKPIIASGWSGHRDFLNEKYTLYVGGQLTKVHPSAVQPHMILPEAHWFSPAQDQATAAYQEVYNNYSDWAKKAEKQGQELSFTKNLGAMGALLKELIDKYLPNFPEEVPLIIPGLENLTKKAE